MFQIQLDQPSGSVFSTSVYDSGSGVIGSTSGGVFIARALELSLVIGRPNSDEVSNRRASQKYPSRSLAPRWRTPKSCKRLQFRPQQLLCDLLRPRAAKIVLSRRPQVVVFQRDAPTGVLSSATTVQLASVAETVGGTIAGVFLSSDGATDTLFVSMAAASASGDPGKG